MKKPVFFVAALLALLFSACAGSLIRTPTFDLKEAGLLRFDAPGIGLPPQAVVRVELEARNPNPFGGTLEDMRFDFVMEGQKVAASVFPTLSLPGNGVPSRVPMDIEIPVTPATVQTLFKIAKGDAVSYRLEGSFRVQTPIGNPKFGPYTFAQGTYKTPAGPPSTPGFAWRSDLTRLTLGTGGLVLDLGFEITNPWVLGYRLVAPLALTVGGQTVARAEAGGSVPAKSKGIVSTRFQIDPLALGAAALRGQFDFQVSSAPTLEVPGFESFVLPVSVLFGGTAKR